MLHHKSAEKGVLMVYCDVAAPAAVPHPNMNMLNAPKPLCLGYAVNGGKCNHGGSILINHLSSIMSSC